MGGAGRGQTHIYDQNHIVFNLTPIIQSTNTPDNLDSRKTALHRRENSLTSTQTKKPNLNSTLNNINQKIKNYSNDKNLSVKDTTADNEGSPKTKPISPISEPPPEKQFIEIKTADFAKAGGFKMTETQTLPQGETLTPKPKPLVKADLNIKHSPNEHTPETSKVPKPKYLPLRNPRYEKTLTAKVTKNALLRFNSEFMPPLDLPKNLQLSARKMPRQNDDKTLFMSLRPKIETDQVKYRCKSLPRTKTKAKPNIQKIQTLINAQGITISNLLAYRSPLKMNEISISGLLGSGHNAVSLNHQKALGNIAFLLTNSGLQEHAENFACEPK